MLDNKHLFDYFGDGFSGQFSHGSKRGG